MLHQIRSMITSGHWWLHQDHRCRDVPSRSSGNVKMSTAVVDSVLWCGIWSFNKLLPWLRLGSVALVSIIRCPPSNLCLSCLFWIAKNPTQVQRGTSESSFGFVIAPFLFFPMVDDTTCGICKRCTSCIYRGQVRWKWYKSRSRFWRSRKNTVRLRSLVLRHACLVQDEMRDASCKLFGIVAASWNKRLATGSLKFRKFKVNPWQLLQQSARIQPWGCLVGDGLHTEKNAKHVGRLDVIASDSKWQTCIIYIHPFTIHWHTLHTMGRDRYKDIQA